MSLDARSGARFGAQMRAGFGAAWTAMLRFGRGSPPGALGTFLGVYTPTLLTILGVILYLRFGWVVGHAGFSVALMIVALANAITLVTTLALSAVATNARVGVGGAYFMISRSLGIEVGGAVGFPLYLSQVLSVTLYAYGLAESLKIVWVGVPVSLAAFVIVAAVGALAMRGAGVALRTQMPVMVFIGISLLGLSVGAVSEGRVARLAASEPSGEYGFWAIFAIFFPAVTGIMAGLGLSGDLRDPVRAIPRGALAAQLTGFAVYLCVPVALAIAADPVALREDPLVWTTIVPGGAWLVLPGLWGAIFSSAVGSMLGAPRTLQALARDELAPGMFAARDGGEPHAGLVLSIGLALVAVLLGDLNAVATVVTMFFLAVYGILNLSAALESLSGDPSWRPAIWAPWPVCLAGAAGCVSAMLLIDARATLIAGATVSALWLGLHRRKQQARWGDARRGLYEALIRFALVRMAKRPLTARSWRPHIMVFTERIESHLGLARFADWFSQDRGVVTVCEVVVGDLMQLELDPLERRAAVTDALDRAEIVAFAQVCVAPSVVEGIVSAAQSTGLAGIGANTVLLGWPGQPEKLAAMLPAMERLERLHRSLIVGRADPATLWGHGAPRVDVWWGGLQQNGDLMLLLAHLLSLNSEWRGCRVRVLSVASNDLMRVETEHMLARLIDAIRIQADIQVRVKATDEKVRDVIHRESARADVVLLGMATPSPGGELEYAKRLFELADGLENFFFVRNNSLFIGDLVLLDESQKARPLPG